MSIKFLSAILGPEMGASILWTPGKMRSFCRRKTHVHKIPRLRGYFGFFLGGMPILFLCLGPDPHLGVLDISPKEDGMLRLR